MKPSRDPDSPKYKNDPNRRLHGGRWKTEEQVQRELEQDRERRRERYWKDPEYRERERTAQRERYRRDPEQKLKQRRERYQTDPEYRERVAERSRERYWNLTGLQYSHRLLQKRRQKALTRMAERNAR